MNGNDNPLAKALAFLITAYPDHAEELGRITNLFLRDPEKARLELFKYRKANPNIRFPKDLELLIEQELQQGEKIDNDQSANRIDNNKKENSEEKTGKNYLIKKKTPPTPKERFKKALENEFIEKQSDGRTSEDYLKEKELSEKDVFDQWYKENTKLFEKKSPSEEESTAYRESEEFKKKVVEETDRRYKEKFAAEIAGFIEIEKSKIYDNPAEDPVLREFKKILSEADEQDSELSEEIKTKALGDFSENYQQKSLAYSKTVPEIQNYLTRATEETQVPPPVIIPNITTSDEGETFSSQSSDEEQGQEDNQEDNKSSGSNQRGNHKNIRERLKDKNINPFRAKSSKNPLTNKASGASRKILEKLARQIVSQVGQKIVIAIGAATWEVWAVLFAILLLFILFILFTNHINDTLNNGSFVNISKSADKEAVVNPPADPNYLTALSTPQDIVYTISVSYSGTIQSITITDPIPENAILVSAENNAELLDANGNTTTDKTLVKTVVWNITPDTSTTNNPPVSASTTTLGDWLNKKLSENPNRLGLSGMGPTIARLSSQYNVPIELALGQFALETQWYSDKGVTVTKGSNNPGNILCSNDLRLGAIGNDIVDSLGNHYCRFSSLEKGIEAYFMHLNSSLYRSAVDEFINTSDPRPVIHIYYSSSNDPSGNTENGYVNTVNGVVKALRDAAVADGVSLSSNSSSETQGNGETRLTLVLRPKQDAKDTYIINQAFAESVGTVSCNTGGAVIVIDPGHSGSSLTTTDPQTQIKDVEYHNVPETEDVFDVATLLKEKLETSGYTAILTKNSASDTVSHRQRAEVANTNNAALAVSIHYDPGAGNFGAWGQVWPQEVGRYRESVSGTKVAFTDQAVADKSLEYAKNIRSARQAIEGPSISLGNFSSRSGLAPGNITLVQLFSKVPWVYNESGAPAGGFTQDQKNKYAEGIYQGILKSIPVGDSSSCTSINTGVTTNLVGNNGSTPIEGVWSGTAQKLVDYLLASNPSPKFTVSAQQLAEYYVKYASEANLRADILWAQMLHETGFGKYGGDVLPSQNNFAGVGATGGGVSGASFATAENGVKAQIAHMAAYVYTTDVTSWTNAQTDPRYNQVSPRGQVKILSDLDGRWAVPGIGYGATIENHVRNINK